jgi:hypothetical protein
MQLVYVSDGVEQDPWVVDSIWLDAALMERSACARVLLRRRPGQPPDDTRVCVRSDTLFGWDARRATWVPQRPVGPNMVFMTQRANGDTVRYLTTVYTDELVSGIALRVLPTMVVTGGLPGAAEAEAGGAVCACAGDSHSRPVRGTGLERAGGVAYRASLCAAGDTRRVPYAKIGPVALPGASRSD